MRVGSFFGIEVRVNPFFAAFLALVWALGHGAEGVILAGVLLSHELAHVLVARLNRIPIERLELYPFGGALRIVGLEVAEPMAEATTALAGPVQNFLLLGLGQLLLGAGIADEPRLDFFLHVNLVMGLFNLLPILPLDGGRVARLILGNRWGYQEAARRLLTWGERAALLSAGAGAVALGLGSSPVSLFTVAIFLWISTRRERPPVQLTFFRLLELKVKRLRERGVLATEGLIALEETTVTDVLKCLMPRRYHRVLVADSGLAVLGELTERELTEEVFCGRTGATVGEVLRRRGPRA